MNAWRADNLEERIARIEQNLSPVLPLLQSVSYSNRLSDRMTKCRVPGLSVAVIDNYRIAWARGYGVLEMGSTFAVTPETIFQAGSVSKPVTAMAVLRLVQDGLLDLDQDINTYLVSWKMPAQANLQTPITLRHLLSHTAGLTHSWYYGFQRGVKPPSLIDILTGSPCSGLPPLTRRFSPGKSYHYSEGHFSVIEQLLVDVTHTPFAELMQKLVLQPLEMYHSSYDKSFPESYKGTLATGHYIGGLPVKEKWRVFSTLGAAGLWTTPSDMARLICDILLARAGMPARVLNKQTVDCLLTTQTPPQERQWGLGFELKGQGTMRRFQHGGENIGYNCFFQAFSELGRGMVLMSNSDVGDGLCKEFAQAIAHEYGWPTYPQGGIYSKHSWRAATHRLGLHVMRSYFLLSRR